jgi:transglutaminase-like putative cysteine protease
MSRKIFLSIVLLPAVLYVLAGEGDYAVDKIPDALLKNADVVKRMEEIRFEVPDIGKSRRYHKYAITVLNEKGDKYAVEVVGYDKLREYKSMEGSLFDAAGKKIRSLKKNEIKDLSATDDISLMDDNRVKVHGFYHRLYPYTVEYETVVQYNGTYFFPSWDPVDNEKISVVQSAITVVAPADFPVRYKSFNYKGEPETGTEKGNRTYRWEIKNFEAIELEYAYPAWDYLAPMLYLAPEKFEIEKYRGNMSTWQELGKFIYTLNEGRDMLPDHIRQTVHQIADPLTNPKEKITRLYNYMQQNTRYISIQLGIGGLQPFDAAYVAAKKYGDCKALSNYMYALLKEAGIKSHYTLVKSGNGRNYFREDFPSSQFNHVILCVPLQKDTVWLECTSQTAPAGYLGGFTSDRPVLLVDENGGRLVRTPKYNIEQNTQVRNAMGEISNEGLLTIHINSLYRGMQQDDLHFLVNGYSHEKQLEYLKRGIDLPHYDVVRFEYQETKSELPVISESLDLTALNYAAITGKRLFILPNIISRSSSKLKADDNRKYPVSLGYEYRDIDTATIAIPEGYRVEAMPPAVKIETKFGNYASSVKVQSNKIIYYRYMERFSGQFSPSDYNELVRFFDEIYKADRSRVVLVKKEG